MTSDQVMALVRTVLQFGGGFAVAKGWASSSDMVEFAGAAATIAAIIWSMWHHAGVNKDDAVRVAGGERKVQANTP